MPCNEQQQHKYKQKWDTYAIAGWANMVQPMAISINARQITYIVFGIASTPGDQHGDGKGLEVLHSIPMALGAQVEAAQPVIGEGVRSWEHDNIGLSSD